MTRNGLETQILTALDEIGAETHTEAIAERLGIVRHTAAKYLQILQAKGQVTCRKVGNAKLWQPIVAGLTIRPLLPEDLPAISKIQSQFQQDETAHRAFVQTIEYHLECTDPALRLGAELQGQLVGFIVGEIRAWEFGVGEPTGWVKVLTVHPEFRNRGIGRQLGEALIGHFRSRAIDRVRTLVDWYAGEMISYFRAIGFEIMPMLPLERRVDVNHKTHKTAAMVTVSEKD
jgi:ribosomal protein S18 acetylase RimI-like enzyme